MDKLVLFTLTSLFLSAPASAGLLRFSMTGKAQFHPWNGPGAQIERYAERDAEEKALAHSACQTAPRRISDFTYSYVPYGTVSATATYECNLGW